MTTNSQCTVVAVFKNLSDAQAAVEELKTSGISAADIYVSSEPEAAGISAPQGTTAHEGGFMGWLKRVFGDTDESERRSYESAVRSGNAVLSVDASNENAEDIADILDNHSPIDVHEEAAEMKGRSTTPVSAAQSGVAVSTSASASTEKSIPVVEEELRVGKRAVMRGGVRVYSRVVEEPIEESVRLREEKVRVDRQPADRSANEAELRKGQDQVIEVKEYAEEPVVSKQARVVEDVRLNKDTTERTETVRDTVRRTEVEVENLGREKSGASDIDEDFRRDFASRYGATGQSYETYSPAYRYGYEMASDPRYEGQDFSKVESDLRADYGRRYPNSTWEKMKDSIRYGWDRVTGRAKATTSSR